MSGEGNKKSQGGITSEDQELIRTALAKTRALPSSLSENDSVMRIIKIRKAVERTMIDRRDPRIAAGRLVRRALLISISSATLVSALGVWRVVDRFTTSLGLFDQPVPFLILFTLLFMFSWLPLVTAGFRSRSMIRRGPRRSEIDVTRELRAFDVALVKGLLKE
ncbi:hypothetical protein KQI63_12265 [bacterium]|nr:hypothetical protein [bacterium]